MRPLRFEVYQGEREVLSRDGRRDRKPTVLIRVGRVSLSQKAFLLGLTLVVCQILDGSLTYIGLYMLGLPMEGNSFLRELMLAYGAAPVLMAAKFVSIGLVVILTYEAHRRLWIRGVIGALIVVYLVLAVWPWTYLISQHIRREGITIAESASINIDDHSSIVRYPEVDLGTGYV